MMDAKTRAELLKLTKDPDRLVGLLEDVQTEQHAMQTGVAHVLGHLMPSGSDVLTRELKHMRVGVNSAMCQVAALAEVLAEAGVVDLADVVARQVQKLNADVRRYEQELEEKFGVKVRLG